MTSLCTYISIWFNLLKRFRPLSVLSWIKDRLGLLKDNYQMTTLKWVKIICRPNTSDRNECYQIICDFEYWFIKKYLSEKYTINVLDIWWNIWLFTLWIHQTIKIWKSIIIEPDKDNIKILTKNILINWLAKRTSIMPYAIYNKDNQLIRFNSNTEHDAKGIDLKNWSTKVKTISLLSLFKKVRVHIDLIKIDIEWWEYNLLIWENIKIFKMIDYIIMEYHDGYDLLIEYFWKENILEHQIYTKKAWLLLISYMYKNAKYNNSMT